jgi:beta-lactamase regulating signal transducer with metallopeptidase domain
VKEAVFPLVGPLFVFAIALPVAAAIVRLVLEAIERLGRTRGLHAHQGLRYVLLVASSGVPLVWFISASLHQAETGESAPVCIATHAHEALCPEAALFALALVAIAALFAAPRLLREQLASAASTSPAARRAAVRIAAVIATRPALRDLRRRVSVNDEAAVPIATVGILSPRVVVRVAFASALDDDALAGALHHELEHVRGRDPLRYFIAWWALAVNPFGRWLLERELSRWLLAREVHCDREAVLDGAGAPALAHALVTAARPFGAHTRAALGAADPATLKLRVELLLAYADRAPHRCCRQPALRFALAALLFAVVLPHGGGTHALDAVHVASEQTVSFLTAR